MPTVSRVALTPTLTWGALQCFSIHKPHGYASSIAHFVAKDQPYVCSKPVFEYIVAPPPPPVPIEQKLYIQRPPSLNTWGPKENSIPTLLHGVHISIQAQVAEPKA